MEHSDRILKIIQERGLTCYKVAKATGLSNNIFTVWKNKPSSKIYSGTLVLIADYLGCSVDYLLGRTENPEVHQLTEGDCIVETVEPDEWDLKMIAEAEKENDGTTVPIEDLAAELGIT